jgi:hypothetical protein
MKRKSEQQAIETHDISANRFPMPGTDLGTTNAIPCDLAVDVDGGSSNSRYVVPSMDSVVIGTRGGRKCS